MFVTFLVIIFSSNFIGELFSEDVGIRLLPRTKETGKFIAKANRYTFRQEHF